MDLAQLSLTPIFPGARFPCVEMVGWVVVQAPTVAANQSALACYLAPAQCTAFDVVRPTDTWRQYTATIAEELHAFKRATSPELAPWQVPRRIPFPSNRNRYTPCSTRQILWHRRSSPCAAHYTTS